VHDATLAATITQLSPPSDGRMDRKHRAL